jgi:hypothetical protein
MLGALVAAQRGQVVAVGDPPGGGVEQPGRGRGPLGVRRDRGATGSCRREQRSDDLAVGAEQGRVAVVQFGQQLAQVGQARVPAEAGVDRDADPPSRGEFVDGLHAPGRGAGDHAGDRDTAEPGEQAGRLLPPARRERP